mmetsp:Transcript_73900/g.175896  ORF Transcript_73900/g.175896 Transcript_73900/m.175896 type:complete len:255 (-) Transcript_73900:196-960(-)|eukprot:CAMPEP_0178423878 /NCGR_PEP_ID=MMETSP0689_2-20121128/27915_1 /TAXON_ID=160604 /ORGANISM="Amphidinium massartii, Strain CS-259" /LENGTH=254 /DNA_ID=CAMNT_0020045485 /DNA_START=131 /DNA_END=895 /DNA_ORIENTATION=+
MQATRRKLGILALQGAFEEHEASFRRLSPETLDQLEIVQVRTISELDSCDALVIPGGESTTMKIIAGTDLFMDHLRAFVHGKTIDGKPAAGPRRPVWGTCAGCILLSDEVLNELPGQTSQGPAKKCKYGEQVGGLPIATCRNFFGRQVESFEAFSAAGTKGLHEDAKKAFENFPAVFIRAPAILRTLEGARALATVQHPLAEALGSEGQDAGKVIVAAESDHVMVTCFHPELCSDERIHRYFVERFVLQQPSSN